MPYNCDLGVSGGKRSMARATFHLPKRAVSHTGVVCLESARGPSDCRPGLITVLWSQLPHWSGNDVGGKGHGGCMIKAVGRRQSLAYLDYVKIPRDQLASYSRILAD